MKSVMISIRPCWCEQIVAGCKTMEVRKKRPKLETPFKCYIYQTKERWVFNLLRNIGFDEFVDILERGFGKVIGEFVCDEIRPFDVPYPAYRNELDKDILDQTCCTYYQLHRYEYHDKLYGWHISKLKIYPKPMRVQKFRKKDCCPYHSEEGCTYPYHCYRAGKQQRCVGNLHRPPQSWCYVEEQNGQSNDQK